MLDLIFALLATARSSFKGQRDLALENLALRQQLAILKRITNRPRLTWIDRALWATLCRVFADWRQASIIVKPETVRDYQDALNAIQAVCSMSRKGDCWDNAVAESFFSTIKNELVHDVEFATRAQARTAIIANGSTRRSALSVLFTTKPLPSSIVWQHNQTVHQTGASSMRFH